MISDERVKSMRKMRKMRMSKIRDNGMTGVRERMNKFNPPLIGGRRAVKEVSKVVKRLYR